MPTDTSSATCRDAPFEERFDALEDRTAECNGAVTTDQRCCLPPGSICNGNEESRGLSGEVDPPLDGHKIESGSMVALRCKRGETGLSHLIHLTKRVPVIHR
jgi:hypothetical protein